MNRREERGAVALMVAACAFLIFGMAALAVDLTMQVNERQELHDTIDAAAHAGAYALPDGIAARSAAATFAAANDPASNPTLDFYCVVASTTPGSGQPSVDASQIPTTCNPGGFPFTVGRYPGLACNAQICAIPCDPGEGDQCNTVRARDKKPVPFGFANVLGIPQGSTGTLSSAACKGSCGRAVSNPMDLVVVGDRTGSMGGAIGNLETAVEGLLETLTPAEHHVALGTIGRSAPPGNGSGNTAPVSCRTKPSSSASVGPWIPVGLSNDYDDTDVTPPSSPAVLSATSTLARAADCMGNANSSTNTYLATPMRAASQLLTGTCPATICAPGLPVRGAPVKKAVIFMTDGEPNENKGDPGGGYPWSTNGTVACNNVTNEATTAKNAGITVVTITFRLEGVRCSGGGSAAVTTVLATMASPKADGTPSLDDGGGKGPGCDTTAKVSGENADGDFFFCTPDPTQLEGVFKSAASQITGGVRLLKLPG